MKGGHTFSLLFILVMKVLCKILRRARNGVFIMDFKVGGRGGEGLDLTHLLFANDTLIF